ncbi:AAA family ATPase [uncultured Pseudodesulfovibrio sp.]|uniref:AAA family ATPase n=1 Tax=uncultured Pseudodesulfovibrio sp. TaxID=2035858 RepID=UPI0029C942F7|nr:AAA family ATPase [uncultured Pseudodesulfovibrio sp.]
MIAKIVLENFMAHERTELELGPGVNALTGPNNTGKSAIVEGLRCLATNPVPKHYIRHGAKEARVSVELEDGTRVVWIRKKRSSGYELWHPGAEEPEEYWKFGRKPPEDIRKALRLDTVDLETGDAVDVHVGNQREPVFLLNQPGSNAAAFFAASTESAHLLAMQNVLKRRTQDAKRRERDLEGRLGVVRDEMDVLAPLPDIALAVETGRELEQSAKKLQGEIPVLEKLLELRGGFESKLAVRTETATILNGVLEPLKLKDVSGLAEIVRQVSWIEKALGKARKTDATLVPAAPPPVIFDTGRMATICGQLQYLGQVLETAQHKGRATAGIAAPPELENTTHLSGLIQEMSVARQRYDRMARWDDALQDVAEPPEVVSDVRLGAFLGDMVRLSAAMQDAQHRLNGLENELQSLKDSIEERVREIGRCPTCGGNFNADEFLDREHVHDA